MSATESQQPGEQNLANKISQKYKQMPKNIFAKFKASYRNNKKKYIWGAVALLVIIIFWRIISPGSKPKYAAAYTVTQQDVRQTVLATGTVTSQSDLNLSFKNSGVVSKVNVAVGDKVRKGQALAVLDQRDASAAINQASASVLAAQSSYDKLVNGASSPEIDVAKAAVQAAQVTLDNAKNSYQSVVSQQKNLVASAQSAMFNAGLAAVPAGSNISTATISVTGTYSGNVSGSYLLTVGVSGAGYTYSFSGLETADGAITRGIATPVGKNGLFFTVSSSGTINSGDSWTISLPNSQSAAYISAYNSYQAALQTQIAALVAAQGAIDSANAALTQAQAALALKQSAARPEDIAAAQAQVATAAAQLQTAQNQYSNNIISAPIDGIVTVVDLKLGETVAPQKTVITMLDQTNLHVESYVSESSIAEVQAGQSIDMTMDAFGPDQHFSGEVLSIDPAATVVSGVINYRVVSSIPSDASIKPGMTANLVVLVAEKLQVIAVPNRLIKTVDRQKKVTLLQGNQTKDVAISTGLAGDTYTEVLSGLSAGDILVSSINSATP